jgi:hypothetical protein
VSGMLEDGRAVAKAEAGGLALAGASESRVRRAGRGGQEGGARGRRSGHRSLGAAGRRRASDGGRMGQERWRRARRAWRRGSESCEREGGARAHNVLCIR